MVLKDHNDSRNITEDVSRSISKLRHTTQGFMFKHIIIKNVLLPTVVKISVMWMQVMNPNAGRVR